MTRAFVAAATVAVLCVTAVRPVQAEGGGIGFKAGLSYSSVSSVGLLPDDLHSRSGFAAGLGMVSGGSVGFGIEGLYAQRGVTSSTPGDSRDLDYVDVPVYLRIAAPMPGITPFAYAGPQASFELQCRAGGADCPGTGRPRTTYAGVIGAGIRLLGGLSVEGRYVYGLSDLKLNTVSTGQSYQARSFLVLVGFGF